MDLYGLDDMCDISYQSEDRIHRDVLDATTSLVAEHEVDHQHLSQPSLTRIANWSSHDLSRTHDRCSLTVRKWHCAQEQRRFS